MTTTRFIDHLLEGDHASRPAASAVPQGTLYSCTTHSLVYQSDGSSSWSTWASLGPAGAYVAGGTDVAVADGGTGASTAAAGFNALSPMTTQDDIIIGGASGAGTRLGKGSDGQVLTVDPSTHHLVWATPPSGFADPMTTRGDIIVRNASNATARLGIGSSGKVLSSDGTDVSWQTPAAGGSGALVFLEAHTASASSSLDFTSFISSTYDTYLIEGVALVMGTDNVNLLVEIGTGGGPTYDTGNNYHWASIGFSSGNTQFNDSGSSGVAKLVKGLDNGLTAFAFTNFSLTAMNLQSTTLNKALFGKTYFLDNSSNVIFSTWGMVWTTAATAVTALRFIPSSGNIASGTIRIYGVSKS